VVDTGSTDATVDIARERGAQIYHFEWIDDFAAARNFSIEQATGDWILVLDADEWVEERHIQQIRALIAKTDCDAFYLIQRNYNDDPREKSWIPVREKTPYTGEYTGFRNNPNGRLFRNGLGIRFKGRVHEIIDASLEGLKHDSVDIPVHHHEDGDPSKPRETRQLNYLRICEEALAEGADGRLCSTAAIVHMYQHQNYHKAIEYFQQAVDEGYEVNDALEGMAEAHYRMGDMERARELYQSLHTDGHRSFSLCNNLANLCVKREEFSRAASLLREALDLGVLHGENAERLRHNIDYLEGRAAAAP
jgi:glycosyltransferase involved in cell wall biosynthesis